jgi:gluconolactonase
MRTSRRIPDAAALAATAAILLLAAACAEPPPEATMPAPGITLERMEPGLEAVVDAGAPLDTLADGFSWSEGPVWVPSLGAVLFSDVPENRIHAWSADAGERVWLEPSGYTGSEPRGGQPGSNGLLLDAEGRLVLCQHGDRRVARLAAPLESPSPAFETLADRHGDARFSSPNDAVYRSDGSLWFTDPPYGLAGPEDREVPFNGVYALFPDGRLVVVTDTLTRPNGIAFSPDGRTLYVANSDPGKAWWAAYDVAEDGTVGEGRLLVDVTGHVGGDEPGLPDGLKVDHAGNLFASGPGGIWVIAPDGEALGRIRLDDPAANVAFGEDGRSLFITASSRLLRTRVLTGQGAAPAGD